MADEKKEPIVTEQPAAAPEPNEDEPVFQERKRWLFLGLPFTFTKYIITPALVTIDTGMINTTENDCYMYKIQDVQLTTSLAEKMFGLGTVNCFTGDVTTPNLVLKHVKNAKEIKNYLLKQSEAARIKRRTLSTMDISAHGGMMDLDHDGIPDQFE